MCSLDVVAAWFLCFLNDEILHREIGFVSDNVRRKENNIATHPPFSEVPQRSLNGLFCFASIYPSLKIVTGQRKLFMGWR
jgi:hypothetical protein